eukprot:269871-Chlamydomonas_euryale.AAC.2
MGGAAASALGRPATGSCACAEMGQWGVDGVGGEHAGVCARTRSHASQRGKDATKCASGMAGSQAGDLEKVEAQDGDLNASDLEKVEAQPGFWSRQEVGRDGRACPAALPADRCELVSSWALRHPVKCWGPVTSSSLYVASGTYAGPRY